MYHAENDDDDAKCDQKYYPYLRVQVRIYYFIEFLMHILLYGMGEPVPIIDFLLPDTEPTKHILQLRSDSRNP
jgi:hypothetical protein